MAKEYPELSAVAENLRRPRCRKEVRKEMKEEKIIDDLELDRIRNEVDLVILASKHTILHRSGHKYVGFCPFCKGSAGGSFEIRSEKQLYHCYHCGVGGDVFTFAMEKENLSFPEAMRYLIKEFDIFELPKKKEDKGLTQEQLDIIKETFRQIGRIVDNCQASLKIDLDDMFR